MIRHPIQPLYRDENGTLRFKANAIVRHLLDHGGIDLNQIACEGFPREDREQFAQLIGYSHSGASELSYFSDEALDASWRSFETGETETEVRLREAEQKLKYVKEKLRPVVTDLYGVHPEDLGD